MPVPTFNNSWDAVSWWMMSGWKYGLGRQVAADHTRADRGLVRVERRSPLLGRGHGYSLVFLALTCLVAFYVPPVRLWPRRRGR
ncbi:hypothetical protein [Sphingobium sp. Ant17]|uniref:hypothetical protein n=1 Tax=Sphingobium sp. Ant17 TaxID=1461752 RepID=UPI001F22D58E|nr:hypothetical protein [Sphingobium sp. Ant17]